MFRELVRGSEFRVGGRFIRQWILIALTDAIHFILFCNLVSCSYASALGCTWNECLYVRLIRVVLLYHDVFSYGLYLGQVKCLPNLCMLLSFYYIYLLPKKRKRTCSSSSSSSFQSSSSSLIQKKFYTNISPNIINLSYIYLKSSSKPHILNKSITPWIKHMHDVSLTP